MPITRPRRRVLGDRDDLIDYGPKSGRGSFLGPDTTRRTNWWELNLECGHMVERYAKRVSDDGRKGNSWHPRTDLPFAPPPTYVRCDYCPPESA